MLFPRLWKVLTERMMLSLRNELIAFINSGSHVHQRDCHPSALHTFCEATWHCVPPIIIQPRIVKYLGKTHNLWHRTTLLLEQVCLDAAAAAAAPTNPRPRAAVSEYDFEPNCSLQQEVYDCLCQLYTLLKEDDLLVSVWLKRAKYQETNIALAYEQHGYFEQAQQAYEQAMSKGRVDHNASPASPEIVPEYHLWEDHWVRCCKELNQWDHLLEYANSKSNVNTLLVMESAWRVPNWGLMKEALHDLADNNYEKENAWKVSLYKGFVNICHPEESHLTGVERIVETSSLWAIKEWRRLPHIVSHIHVPFLQAAQQIMELQEAAQINQGLQPANITRDSSAHDMKAIVKTWRNRLPMISDDLSHWSDIFTWRQHHYQQVVSLYEAQASTTHDPNQSNNSMLGVHASAQSIIHFGKIARKHGLTGVCLDSLSRIHTIPSVPIVDCFQKIRQQVKCYLQMAAIMGKNELQEGLEVIESTNLKYFSKEMTAEFYAIKGMFLAQIGRSDDANKAFSAAVQMHDTLCQAWALWGDYLENIFTREKQIDVGTNTIICFLHACRNQTEYKSRRYLAKILWLLTYDNENQTLAEAVDKYSVGVPPIQWLPWIPQLLVCLIRNEGKLLLNLLSKVGSVYPQAVYFPLRTLYLTLKIEQRERYAPTMQANLARQMSEPPGSQTPVTSEANTTTPSTTTPTTETLPTSTASNIPTTSSTSAQLSTPLNVSLSSNESQGASTGAGDQSQEPIRATAPMWRCSRIMHMQRDIHPTILHSLEGIVDQMVWFRENWYEEVCRQLTLALAKCHNTAFEHGSKVLEASVTPSTISFVKKLVTTFGVGVESVIAPVTQFSSSASECVAKRAVAAAGDPIFQRLKAQFTSDFDFSVPNTDNLHTLINKLKKWIKILEAKIKVLPKSFLLEEKCRFLSNFTMQTAEVEIPGEFLLPKHSHYYVRIARFLPTIDIVHKQNFAARRLYIRGHNGKIYPYLIINDAGLSESRREERVLQLVRMLGQFLPKMKESSRRLLNVVAPRVVAISPQMRLVEDSVDSLSMHDVYKQCCVKRNMDHDTPVTRYYERLASMQGRGMQATHQVLRDVMRDVQANQVPRTMIKEWVAQVYPNATDYWTFRKNFTAHLAVQGFLEFVLHLTKMNPTMTYIYLDSGAISVAYFVFDIDEHSGDLDANRPVPFRLSPNLGEFITPIGVAGPLTASMITVARCLVQPQYKVPSLLKAVLRDEYITWYKKRAEEQGQNTQPADIEGEYLVQVVNKAVTAIMSRLQSLATFDGAESRVSTLVAAASSIDNLCRMDPTWQPWL